MESNGKEWSKPNQEKHLNKEDWFLQSFIDTANDSDSEGLMGVTLLTHGFLVSGMLISRQAYFRGFAEEFSNALEENKIESTNEFKELFSDMGNDFYKEDVEGKSKPTIYIHLKNAKFFDPSGSTPSGNGVWWRGRISEISGFSFGLLETSEED